MTRLLFILAVVLGILTGSCAAQTPFQSYGDITPMMQAPIPAQVWFKVAPEGATVAYVTAITSGASIPPPTVRFGAAQGTPSSIAGGAVCATVGGCWEYPAKTPASPFYAAVSSFPGPDPIYGTAKELDVLETSVAQTVTVNGVAVPIPALPVIVVTPPVVTPVKTWSCTANTAVTFSLMSDGTFQLGGPVACKETL